MAARTTGRRAAGADPGRKKEVEDEARWQRRKERKLALAKAHRQRGDPSEDTGPGLQPLCADERSTQRVGSRAARKHQFSLGQMAHRSEVDEPSTREDMLIKIARLKVGDGAWVRRSGRIFTYATLKRREDGPEATLVFTVDKRGSTKKFPVAHWAKFMRLVAERREDPPSKKEQDEINATLEGGRQGEDKVEETRGKVTDETEDKVEEEDPALEKSVPKSRPADAVTRKDSHSSRGGSKKTPGRPKSLQEHEVSMFTFGLEDESYPSILGDGSFSEDGSADTAPSNKSSPQIFEYETISNVNKLIPINEREISKVTEDGSKFEESLMTFGPRPTTASGDTAPDENSTSDGMDSKQSDTVPSEDSSPNGLVSDASNSVSDTDAEEPGSSVNPAGAEEVENLVERAMSLLIPQKKHMSPNEQNMTSKRTPLRRRAKRRDSWYQKVIQRSTSLLSPHEIDELYKSKIREDEHELLKGLDTFARELTAVSDDAVPGEDSSSDEGGGKKAECRANVGNVKRFVERSTSLPTARGNREPRRGQNRTCKHGMVRSQRRRRGSWVDDIDQIKEEIKAAAEMPSGKKGAGGAGPIEKKKLKDLDMGRTIYRQYGNGSFHWALKSIHKRSSVMMPPTSPMVLLFD